MSAPPEGPILSGDNFSGECANVAAGELSVEQVSREVGGWSEWSDTGALVCGCVGQWHRASLCRGSVARPGLCSGRHRRPHSAALEDRSDARRSSARCNRAISVRSAAKLGVCAHTVGVWRKPFASERMDGLYDEPRPGAPRQIGDEEIAATIRKTLETRPRGAPHWTLRTMAKAVGHCAI